MEALGALIMGLVEGLTEFLPISSTGHLILVGHWLGFEQSMGEELTKVFEIVIQLGAILAVVAAYPGRFSRLVQFGDNRGLAGLRGLGLLAVTSLPAGLLALSAGKFIQDRLFNSVTVAAALAVGAVWILVVEYFQPRPRLESVDAIGWREAFSVGLFQCLALWPGMSRSASTILGGMISGVERKAATEYSFFAAVPIMIAATGYELLKHRQVFASAHFDIVQSLSLRPMAGEAFYSKLSMTRFVASRRSTRQWEGKQRVSFLERARNRRTDKFIANSNMVARLSSRLEQVPVGKVATIYDGVTLDEDVMKGAMERGRKLRREMGIQEIDFVVVNVASLRHSKGQMYLLKAFHGAKAKFLGDAHLVLCGEGEDKDNLELYIKVNKLENRVHIIDSEDHLGVMAMGRRVRRAVPGRGAEPLHHRGHVHRHAHRGHVRGRESGSGHGRAERHHRAAGGLGQAGRCHAARGQQHHQAQGHGPEEQGEGPVGVHHRAHGQGARVALHGPAGPGREMSVHIFGK